MYIFFVEFVDFYGTKLLVRVPSVYFIFSFVLSLYCKNNGREIKPSTSFLLVLPIFDNIADLSLLP